MSTDTAPTSDRLGRGATVTPLLRYTRGLYVTGVCVASGTGIALFVAPGRTADYWAWTIKSPPTAAFFGASYIGAVASLALAARVKQWERTRVVAVVVTTLTSLALLETLRNLDQFAFSSGGLTEVVAWVWLVVYAVFPPLALTAFVLQERAVKDGRGEAEAETPALRATRLVLGGAGAVLGVLGVALLAEWGWAARNWPWPLAKLPAGIVGAWLCTYAVAFLWFALRERSWSRVRVGVAPVMISLALDLIAVVRLHDDLRGGVFTAVYVAALVALLAVLTVVTVIEENRPHVG
jgi:hypothetical protein